MGFLGFIVIGLGLIIAFLGFLFVVGITLLIDGIVRKRKPINAGKKSPIVCIVSGGLCLLLPIGTVIFVAVSLLMSIYSFHHPNTNGWEVTDGWRNNIFVTDSGAKREAINALLVSADEGDRDSFVGMFTPNLQKREGFNDAVDAFFRSYPSGLSLCERDGGHGMSVGDSDGQRTSASYTCSLDGKKYYIRLRLCYENLESPDDVGVTFFCIENLEANALDRKYGEDEFLVCEIK